MRVADAKDINLTLDLALRVGEVLLASGAGAADVNATMTTITTACGLRNVEVDVTFTSLALSYQPRPAEQSHSQMRQLRRRTADYGTLTSVDLLVRALMLGEIDRDEARSALASITSSGRRYPRWVASLGWGSLGVGASLVIGGDWFVSVVAFFAAVAIDWILRALARRRIPAFYQQVAGAFFATALAVVVHAAGIPVNPEVLVTAGIIILLAGVALVGAVQDALSGYYVTASARGLEAMLMTGGIIAGVSGGIAMADRIGIEISFSPFVASWPDLPQMLAGGGIAAAGFAVASYAPSRAILPIGAVGVLGAAVYRTLGLVDVGVAWASALAAIVIGVVAYSVAGRFRIPSLIVVVSGIVPLLPGLSIYRGLFLLSEGVTQGLVSLATALAIAVALASGVILGEYVAQPLKREARRLEARLAGPRLVGPFRPRSQRSIRRGATRNER
jgi:uncharacterized membrane protein YjjP (DUF1212 family)